MSHPRVGAWIERHVWVRISLLSHVAPRVGAWIERGEINGRRHGTGVAPHASA